MKKLTQKQREFIEQSNRIDAKFIDHEFLMKYRRQFDGWQKADFEKYIPRQTQAKIHRKWDALLKEASEVYSDLLFEGKITKDGFLLPSIGTIGPPTMKRKKI